MKLPEDPKPRLTYLKARRQKRYQVEFESRTEDGKHVTYPGLKTMAAPLPRFFDALKALVPDVLTKCELPADWIDGETSIVELWVTYNEDESISIKAKLLHNLEDLETNWTITTPQYEIGGVEEKKLQRIEREAIAWFNGDREQGELDFDGGTAGNGEAADPAPPIEEEETEAVPA